MNQEDMKYRTKDFALRVIRLVRALPRTMDSGVIGKQLLRSATSVAANYRAACRAKSTADFISKLSIVEEEADESLFWIELIVDSDIIKKELIKDLYNEGNQLVAIIVSTKKKAREKNS